METVYLLWHVRGDDAFAEDAKLIGVYSSADKAEAARRRAAERPGFSDQPDGFHVDPYRVDQDHWTSGFGWS